ncbi:CoA transferase subunit A [Amycolatopsis pithecellobii]|nr:CoA transferase subunit A [Amycolatopsis pithecellobii]
MPEPVALLGLDELVAEHVQDGQQLFVGGFAFSDPIALAHEIVRQERRDLEILKTSGGLLVDMLVGAGCVRRLLFCHVWNSVGPQPAHAFRRAVEEGVPHPVEVDELSYGSFAMGLAAGAWGLPFLPTTPMSGAGHFEVRRTWPDKLGTVPSPFGGEPVTVVKAIRPRLGIFHVQRIDRYGNAQMFGPTAEIRMAIAACDRVFVIAEEIVEPEVIRSRPELTVAPGFLVEAAVVEPWSAHPTDCSGYYVRDLDHHDLYGAATRTPEGFDAYLREWVYGTGSHKGYRDRLGEETRAALTLRGAW